MSPLSDTTNIASSITETDIFSHIGSMLWTTIPAAVISVIIYAVIGLKYNATEISFTEVETIAKAISSNFNISILTLIPIVCVIALSIKKVPALVSLGVSVIISAIIAFITQGLGIKELCSNNEWFQSQTGQEIVD